MSYFHSWPTHSDLQSKVIPMLDVEQRTISCPDRTLFDQTNFRAADGELVAIISEVLDGGTSLMQALAGMLSGLEGQIMLNGVDVLTMTPSERAQSIGYAYEEHGLISLYNVFQNIALPLEFHTSLGVRQTESKILTLLDELGVDHALLEAQPHELNDVQTRMVNLARALVMDPNLVLIDELEGGMPDDMIDSVMLALKKRKGETGQTIIMTTSDDHILREADRVLKIHDRQLLELIE